MNYEARVISPSDCWVLHPNILISSSVYTNYGRMQTWAILSYIPQGQELLCWDYEKEVIIIIIHSHYYWYMSLWFFCLIQKLLSIKSWRHGWLGKLVVLYSHNFVYKKISISLLLALKTLSKIGMECDQIWQRPDDSWKIMI